MGAVGSLLLGGSFFTSSPNVALVTCWRTARYDALSGHKKSALKLLNTYSIIW